jgi:hypothetical protein
MTESLESPSSTISSDRDNMSLQSTSSGSNSSSLSHRNSSNSFELHQQLLITEHQPILQGQERSQAIRINEPYRRRCYRAGLNIFNKYVYFFSSDQYENRTPQDVINKATGNMFILIVTFMIRLS